MQTERQREREIKSDSEGEGERETTYLENPANKKRYLHEWTTDDVEQRYGREHDVCGEGVSGRLV